MSRFLRTAAATLLAHNSFSHGQNIYCSSLQYAGLHPLFDSFCQSACNDFSGTLPGYCPSDLCQCAGDIQPDTAFCASPRSCQEYVANPGTTATDEWCQLACPGALSADECPCTLCLCKSSGTESNNESGSGPGAGNGNETGADVDPSPGDDDNSDGNNGAGDESGSGDGNDGSGSQNDGSDGNNDDSETGNETGSPEDNNEAGSESEGDSDSESGSDGAGSKSGDDGSGSGSGNDSEDNNAGSESGNGENSQCPNGNSIRREWHDLTETDKQRYVEATRVLYDDGTLRRMCTMHSGIASQGHGDPYFFPFHRCLLKSWEDELNRVGWNGGMPYWDATLYSEDLHADPIWQHFGNFDGNCINTGVFSGIEDANGACIRRTGRRPSTTYPPSWKQTTKNNNPNWDDYRRANEFTQHGQVHVSIGGQMGSVSSSACDPIFYLHHAAIDYYWHDWQATYDPTHVQYAPGRSTTEVAPMFAPRTISQCLSNIGLCVDYQHPQTSGSSEVSDSASTVQASQQSPQVASLVTQNSTTSEGNPESRSQLPPRLTEQEAADLAIPFNDAEQAEESVENALLETN